jgi:hypothetical protein
VFDSLQGQKMFPFSITSKLALGPTQPPIQWVPGVKRPGRELTIHFHLVPRLRMIELYLHSPVHLYDVVIKPKDNFAFTITLL